MPLPPQPTMRRRAFLQGLAALAVVSLAEIDVEPP